MGPAPQLNTIQWQATLLPKDISYLPYKPGETFPAEVDKRYVDKSKLKLTERLIDPSRSWSFQGTFSLWGARAGVFAVDPAPIFLRENKTTAHDTAVRFAVEPAAFARELLPAQVLFELKRGSQSMLAANASEKEADGSFKIAANLPLQEGQYTANLTVLGVMGQKGESLLAPPIPVEAGIVTLTVDTNNDTVVDDKDDEEFRKDASKAFGFWEADPDPPQEMDKLQDYTTVRIRVPMALLPGETLALRMEASKWQLRRKLGTGKNYLKDGAAANAQLASLSDGFQQPVGLLQDRWEIPAFLLQPGDNEFLMKCEAPSDGKPGCPADRLELQRVIGMNARPVLTERKVKIKPVKAWMSLYTARSPFTPRVPASRLTPAVGWVGLPIREKASRITVLVHGFNVNLSAAEKDTFPTLLKRLYWVGHPVLAVQRDEAGGYAHAVGVAWPGDEAGPIWRGPTTLAYYPEDEMNALESGVPVALFLSRELGGRQVNALAHSLGNMVMNSAIALAPPDTVKKYIMYDAAVPAEAFSPGYILSQMETDQMAPQAQQQGYPSDARWVEEWRQMQADHLARLASQACPTPDAPELCPTDVERWQFSLSQLNATLVPKPDYVTRWRQYAPSSSAWRGWFSGNLTRTQMFNAYNELDEVLRIDEGAVGTGPVSVHAWYACQAFQKPNVGFLGLSSDGRLAQYWAPLQNTGVDEEGVLWAAAIGDPALARSATDRARLTRRWAEMAFWFPSLSGPAGTSRMPFLASNHNISLSAEGKSEKLPGTDSHSYLVEKPFHQVWRPFEVLRDILH
jgi:hypothetical protein